MKLIAAMAVLLLLSGCGGVAIAPPEPATASSPAAHSAAGKTNGSLEQLNNAQASESATPPYRINPDSAPQKGTGGLPAGAAPAP